jgi:hypothetical protein
MPGKGNHLLELLQRIGIRRLRHLSLCNHCSTLLKIQSKSNGRKGDISGACNKAESLYESMAEGLFLGGRNSAFLVQKVNLRVGRRRGG